MTKYDIQEIISFISNREILGYDDGKCIDTIVLGVIIGDITNERILIISSDNIKILNKRKSTFRSYNKKRYEGES